MPRKIGKGERALGRLRRKTPPRIREVNANPGVKTSEPDPKYGIGGFGKNPLWGRKGRYQTTVVRG